MVVVMVVMVMVAVMVVMIFGSGSCSDVISCFDGSRMLVYYW